MNAARSAAARRAHRWLILALYAMCLTGVGVGVWHLWWNFTLLTWGDGGAEHYDGAVSGAFFMVFSGLGVYITGKRLFPNPRTREGSS